MIGQNIPSAEHPTGELAGKAGLTYLAGLFLQTCPVVSMLQCLHRAFPTLVHAVIVNLLDDLFSEARRGNDKISSLGGLHQAAPYEFVGATQVGASVAVGSRIVIHSP